jgi:hypothetical protein
VDVSVTNDQILEGIENFFGVLRLPSGSIGVSLGDDRATATIQDEDGELLKIQGTVEFRTSMQISHILVLIC